MPAEFLFVVPQVAPLVKALDIEAPDLLHECLKPFLQCRKVCGSVQTVVDMELLCLRKLCIFERKSCFPHTLLLSFVCPGRLGLVHQQAGLAEKFAV